MREGTPVSKVRDFLAGANLDAGTLRYASGPAGVLAARDMTVGELKRLDHPDEDDLVTVRAASGAIMAKVPRGTELSRVWPLLGDIRPSHKWKVVSGVECVDEYSALTRDATAIIVRDEDAVRRAAEDAYESGDIPPGFDDEKEVVLQAVRVDGRRINDASDALKSDRDVTLAAVRNNGSVLEDLPEPLRGDPEVVLAAVSRDGRALRHASMDMRADRGVVLAAVRHSGAALEYASDELRADRRVVLAASGALRYASDALREDRDFVLEVVNRNAYDIMYASEEVRDDRGVALAVVQSAGLALTYVSQRLQADPDVVLAAAAQNVYSLCYADASLAHHPGVRNFVLRALREASDTRHAELARFPLVRHVAWLNRDRSPRAGQRGIDMRAWYAGRDI